MVAYRSGVAGAIAASAGAATDMKGFLACVLAAVPDFLKRRLKVPIHLAFSYDEEVGCLGVRPLIAEFDRGAYTPRLVIVGEPTSMSVVDAHKGPVRWHVEVRGRAAHSSMAPLGVNAIAYRRQAAAGACPHRGASSRRCLAIQRFDPPYATLQVTRIDGGTATTSCRSRAASTSMFARCPASTSAPIDQRIRAVRRPSECVPADAARARPRPVSTLPSPTRCRRSRGARLRGGRARAAACRPERDARRLLRDRGRPVPVGGLALVVIGPGDIAQAHAADEFIARGSAGQVRAPSLDRLGAWAERGAPVH